ncbi:hypothetical protein ABMA28_003184 [Loxostege sticticalis]|uniref:Uncharacterized protein n=1 Tax=Loxostege sticticalis TaxID=481309 RepID=A0ABD0SVA5_LOXSC
MARRKKLSREELLEKKRLAEKARRDKIKLNPESHAEYKEKEKQRYQKRKEDIKLLQIQDLTPRQKRIQRRRWNINSKNFRDRKRLKVQLEKILANSTPPETDSDETDAGDITEESNRLRESSPSILQGRPVTRSVSTVDESAGLAMPGPSRQCDSPKSDISSVKRRLRYNVSKKLLWYHKQLNELKRHNDMLRKRLLRYKNKQQYSKSPRTKVELLLKNPSNKDEVKKNLVFAETIKDNLTSNYENLKTNKQKKEFKENIKPACQTLKKYKMLKDLKPKIVRKVIEKPKLHESKNRIRKDITSFFESDDNSRMTAGKKECITRNKEKKQKRFLANTLKNLHKKCLENHQYVVSYSFFCKNKPFWVVHPEEKDKESCMCKIHDNISLLAQALYNNKIIIEKTASEVLASTVCNTHNLTCLERKCPICINKLPSVKEFDNSVEIKYWMWEYGTKEINTKKGEKIIKISEKKEHKDAPKAILEQLIKHLDKFYMHCANITNQYVCTTTLKSQLNLNEAVIHMDFSKNYSTKYNTEIQSLHFGGSRNQISLHTSVVYLPGREPQSFCTYSDCLRHDAFAVWGHIVPILKFIEQKALKTDTLHFITDSTCSQYRNKTINYIITKLHWDLKNLKCVTWNYTEAGHGKGAPDGVGAALKRTADQIVRYGKDIPDVNTFAAEMKKAVKNVLLEYVSEYEIYEKEYFMPTTLLKPFKGMMQVHQIIWNKNNENTVVLRRQSCVSEMCKDKAIICVHGKHIGFYHLPMPSSPPAKEKPIILSNILIAPGSIPVEIPPKTSSSNHPSDVVLLHRSQKFIATGNFGLPPELQNINIDDTNNILFEDLEDSVINQNNDNEHLPKEILDVELSRLTPDLNYVNMLKEPPAEQFANLGEVPLVITVSCCIINMFHSVITVFQYVITMSSKNLGGYKSFI